MKCSSPRPLAILFDLDGTLVDTIGDITFAVNSVLTQCNATSISEQTCKLYVGSGLRNTLIRALQESGISPSQEMLKTHLDLLMRTYWAHPYDRATLYPGVRRFLEKAVADGIPLGVLSNKEEQLVRQIVQALLPEVPFLSVRGATGAFPLKPDPAAALDFAQSAAVERNRVLLIGDSEVDYHTAQAGGMQVAIGTWGFRSRSELERYGCSPLYHAMEEIETEVFSWR